MEEEDFQQQVLDDVIYVLNFGHFPCELDNDLSRTYNELSGQQESLQGPELLIQGNNNNDNSRPIQLANIIYKLFAMSDHRLSELRNTAQNKTPPQVKLIISNLKLKNLNLPKDPPGKISCELQLTQSDEKCTTSSLPASDHLQWSGVHEIYLTNMFQQSLVIHVIHHNEVKEITTPKHLKKKLKDKMKITHSSPQNNHKETSNLFQSDRSLQMLGSTPTLSKTEKSKHDETDTAKAVLTPKLSRHVFGNFYKFHSLRIKNLHKQRTPKNVETEVQDSDLVHSYHKNIGSFHNKRNKNLAPQISESIARTENLGFPNKGKNLENNVVDKETPNKSKLKRSGSLSRVFSGSTESLNKLVSGTRHSLRVKFDDIANSKFNIRRNKNKSKAPKHPENIPPNLNVSDNPFLSEKRDDELDSTNPFSNQQSSDDLNGLDDSNPFKDDLDLPKLQKYPSNLSIASNMSDIYLGSNFGRHSESLRPLGRSTSSVSPNIRSSIRRIFRKHSMQNDSHLSNLRKEHIKDKEETLNNSSETNEDCSDEEDSKEVSSINIVKQSLGDATTEIKPVTKQWSIDLKLDLEGAQTKYFPTDGAVEMTISIVLHRVVMEADAFRAFTCIVKKMAAYHLISVINKKKVKDLSSMWWLQSYTSNCLEVFLEQVSFMYHLTADLQMLSRWMVGSSLSEIFEECSEEEIESSPVNDNVLSKMALEPTYILKLLKEVRRSVENNTISSYENEVGLSLVRWTQDTLHQQYERLHSVFSAINFPDDEVRLDTSLRCIALIANSALLSELFKNSHENKEDILFLLRASLTRHANIWLNSLFQEPLFVTKPNEANKPHKKKTKEASSESVEEDTPGHTSDFSSWESMKKSYALIDPIHNFLSLVEDCYNDVFWRTVKIHYLHEIWPVMATGVKDILQRLLSQDDKLEEQSVTLTWELCKLLSKINEKGAGLSYYQVPEKYPDQFLLLCRLWIKQSGSNGRLQIKDDVLQDNLTSFQEHKGSSSANGAIQVISMIYEKIDKLVFPPDHSVDLMSCVIDELTVTMEFYAKQLHRCPALQSADQDTLPLEGVIAVQCVKKVCDECEKLIRTMTNETSSNLDNNIAEEAISNIQPLSYWLAEQIINDNLSNVEKWLHCSYFTELDALRQHLRDAVRPVCNDLVIAEPLLNIFWDQILNYIRLYKRQYSKQQEFKHMYEVMEIVWSIFTNDLNLRAAYDSEHEFNEIKRSVQRLGSSTDKLIVFYYQDRIKDQIEKQYDENSHLVLSVMFIEGDGLTINIVQSPSSQQFPVNTAPTVSTVSTINHGNPFSRKQSFVSTISSASNIAKSVIQINVATKTQSNNTYLKVHMEPSSWFKEVKPLKTNKRKGHPAVFDQELKFSQLSKFHQNVREGGVIVIKIKSASHKLATTHAEVIIPLANISLVNAANKFSIPISRHAITRPDFKTGYEPFEILKRRKDDKEAQQFVDKIKKEYWQ